MQARMKAIMVTLATLVYGAVGLAVGYYASRLDGMVEYRLAGFVVLVLAPIVVVFQIFEIWRNYRNSR